MVRGNDIIEIRNDGAKHPEAPKLVLAGYWSWNASHQEKLGDFGRRCPGLDTAFGFIVEQRFNPQGRTTILVERGGGFVPVGLPELVSAQRARDAPPQQMASQYRHRLRAIRAAVRAALRWSRGDQAMR
ncbi:hypothetical protein MesoLjLa_69540 (plasmid) [Mesorhizobium sp. L-2-11]|nr:hypothetical protein MesoLjLa_69540 [Mesorhizobium sp. L-2-11]